MNFDINNPPEEITLTVIPVVSEYGGIYLTDIMIDGYVQIAEPMDITFKVRQRDEITSRMVYALKAEKQKIIADSEVKCNHIDDKIHQLLALPSPVE